MSAAANNPMTPRADLRLRGGRVIDPANEHDGIADVAIRNGRVVAVGAAAQDIPARREIDARGAIVTPGFIDMHVHIYEWVTNFGVPADAAGIQSGATTRISASRSIKTHAFNHGSINTPGFIMPFGSSSRLAPRSARANSSGRCLS